MDWSNVKAEPSRKVLRQFAGIWLVLFLGLAAQNQFMKSRPIAALAWAVVALVVGLPGLLRPALVRWIYSGSMVLAFPIGWCVSNFLLATMYFGVVTPIGLVRRWLGRDELGLRPAPGHQSFWDPKPAPCDVSSYFRQY
ncbi:MAG: SxtJ family membrane protein [Verrucomicrobiota bacterium]